MAQYKCNPGRFSRRCTRKFQTLPAARIHNEQINHTVVDSLGKPINSYSEETDES